LGRANLIDRELLRVESFGRVVSGDLSLSEACALLGLSDRHGKRLWKRYRTDGAAGLQHGLRLAGISDDEAANRYLAKSYVDDPKSRFQRDAASDADFHRKCPGKQPPLEAKLQADAHPSSGLLKTSTQGTFLSRRMWGHFYCGMTWMKI